MREEEKNEKENRIVEKRRCLSKFLGDRVSTIVEVPLLVLTHKTRRGRQLTTIGQP